MRGRCSRRRSGNSRGRRRPGCSERRGLLRKARTHSVHQRGGNFTILSASTMPDEVQAAVALAAKKPVHLLELHEAAGNYLAKKLRCGGALVTSGASAGLTLGTAACITMGNKDAIVNI